jgi:hypothetical protein
MSLTPEQPQTSLELRRAFLKKPLADRQQILAQQAETIIAHYQESNEWRELMAGDIIKVEPITLTDLFIQHLHDFAATST